MGCSDSEKVFQQWQSIVVSVVKSGVTALVNIENRGPNVVQLRRILLGWSAPGGWNSVLYLRPPPDPVSWIYYSAFLEPSFTGLFYTLNGVAPGQVVQVQAEYLEFDGRSRSCATIM